jgi:hypothetical protein
MSAAQISTPASLGHKSIPGICTSTSQTRTRTPQMRVPIAQVDALEFQARTPGPWIDALESQIQMSTLQICTLTSQACMLTSRTCMLTSQTRAPTS